MLLEEWGSRFFLGLLGIAAILPQTALACPDIPFAYGSAMAASCSWNLLLLLCNDVGVWCLLEGWRSVVEFGGDFPEILQKS